MNKTCCLLLAVLVVPLLLVSCNSTPRFQPDFTPSAADRLTTQEKDDIIFHARKFIVKSSKLKITQSEQRRVMAERPAIREFYSGHKQGSLRLEWAFSTPLPDRAFTSSGKQEYTHRIIRMILPRGDMLRTKPDWEVKIFTNTTPNPVPPGFVKDDMVLSLPPR